MANTSHNDLMTRRLVDVAELAELTALSRPTIWRHHADGLIPRGIKIGRSVRWRLDVISAWLDAGCPAVRAESSSKEDAE